MEPKENYWRKHAITSESSISKADTIVINEFSLLPRSFPVTVKGSQEKKDLVSKPHVIQSTRLSANGVKEDVVLTLSGPGLSGQTMADPGGCSAGQRAFLDHGCNIGERT